MLKKDAYYVYPLPLEGSLESRFSSEFRLWPLALVQGRPVENQAPGGPCAGITRDAQSLPWETLCSDFFLRCPGGGGQEFESWGSQHLWNYRASLTDMRASAVVQPGQGGALTNSPSSSLCSPAHFPCCTAVPALHWVVIFFPKGNPGNLKQTDLFPATREHRVVVHSQGDVLFLRRLPGYPRCRCGADLPSAGEAKTSNI